ncbi:hypothetical protein OFM39_30135, partial [Escherichia coli]|nr:hypothetical protein [Escherichia coli]
IKFYQDCKNEIGRERNNTISGRKQFMFNSNFRVEFLYLVQVKIAGFQLLICPCLLFISIIRG